MTHPDTGDVLINGVASFKDGSPLSKDIEGIKTGQFSLSDFPIEFDRNLFPYDLNIKMVLDCPDHKTMHSFSKKINFHMEQPVIWKQ